MIQENDLTRDPQSFIIVASVRSGGTMLAHALDSHSLIFCTRGEPLHSRSVWHRAKLSNLEILELLTSQTGFQASGLKVQCGQFMYPSVTHFLDTRRPKIIRVQRQNLLRQAVSVRINTLVRKRYLKIVPQHTFTEVEKHQLEITPVSILKIARELRKVDRLVNDRLSAYEGLVYQTTYEQLTDQAVIGAGTGSWLATELPSKLSTQLCRFLGVNSLPIFTYLQKINFQPLKEILRNWEEIRLAIEQEEPLSEADPIIELKKELALL